MKKSKKAKADTLSSKVSKANIKNLKEHIYTNAAFFERCRDEFLDKENEKFTLNNIERPTNFPSGFYNFKITDVEYNNLPYNVKSMIDEYGNTLKNTYLERVINNKLGIK
jgi:hypothetical protein